MNRTDNLTGLCILCCCFLAVNQAAAAGYEHEIAEALAPRVTRGEAVWLEAAGDRFLGIYHQHLMTRAQGVAIIVHGMGAHPDWPEVIAPLRLDLPAGGWATLSIQMPVLEPGDPLSGYGTTFKQAGNRIRASIRHLKEKKFLNIVIIGYGFGATTVASYLCESGGDIQAFIGISMQSYDFLNPRHDLIACLERIDVPVLDLYGELDLSEVLRLAEQRRLMARKMDRRQFQQISIDGADHYFTGLEDVMTRRVRGWLDKAAPGVRVIADEKLKSRIETDNNQDQPAE